MKKIIGAVCLTAFVAFSYAGTATATTQVGVASFYKSGRVTANGERFNPFGFTAAHRTLKFGTKVRVTNLRNGKSVVVRINDRGPFVRGRIIDLALGAARMVGMGHSGVVKVRVAVLD
jgi:rare lipoprotein A